MFKHMHQSFSVGDDQLVVRFTSPGRMFKNENELFIHRASRELRATSGHIALEYRVFLLQSIPAHIKLVEHL